LGFLGAAVRISLGDFFGLNKVDTIPEEYADNAYTIEEAKEQVALS